ncbi:periplasmic binding protein-like II [Coccomyxa subellipsoidea C-169]|uniref:Periplasmic binding protein-like II n=1 Tax=Coccomyxa subellipsoidea (strain C-169) TaxID=574566 RepID=I0YQC3_COCSC|nr:periplasmic binding protein-like II [Coccomyxa subellipsoidea C-169]EIE20592.1 periplasmic binding protein-like II [Coccomyxa subellipsoidea C-169]|eukprot:XP_005645136.1 periplasmic binding protein-like II [Coccomyxa subellipsoidea C-169]
MTSRQQQLRWPTAQWLAAAIFVLASSVEGVEKDKSYTIVGGGGTALRDFVSDAVGNATQDSNYKGQQSFLNNTFQYAIGDFPLSKKDFEAAQRPILQIPISFGPVVIVANLTPEFHASSTLQLSAPVTAAIFQGNITTWDDPAILAINPNLTKLQPPIPAGTKIRVVGRSDSNAAAYAFSQWVSQAGNGSWALGVNKTLPTGPTAKVVTGGGNVTTFLLNTPFSIGYTDAYAGKKAKLPDAALQNEAGKFIRYSKADWTFPGVNISIPAATADWSKFNLTNLPGEKTYPVVTTSILLTNNDLTGRETRGAAQKAVFGYLLGPAVQTAARSYEQFPLNDKFLNASLTAVNSIRVLDPKDFFESNQLPKLGAPYNINFQYN